MRRAAPPGLRWPVVVIPAVFVSLFFIFPVATVISRGLSGGAGADTTLFELWGSPRFRRVAWFTLWQAVLSTAATLVVALPAAGLVARLAPAKRRVARALVTVPFVLPTVVVAGAFDAVFIRFGLDGGDLRLRHTVWAILLAHVFFNYAVVVRVVGSAWAALDHRVEDQARTLGADPLRVWWEVTLPRLRPAIAAAAAIVFLFSFTSFGVVLVLGGPRRSTLETEIYREAVTRTDLTAAAGLAVVQLVIVVGLIAATTWMERRRPVATAMPRTDARPVSLRAIAVNAAVALVLLGLPLASLVERSLHVGDGYGLANYQALTERISALPAPATTALVNSVLFAIVATALAAAVGTMAALVVVHGRRGLGHVFDLGLTLPLGTSAVTLGFGILIALDEPPLDLRTRWWIVPIAHALVGIPFVVRTMVPVLRSVDDRLREAAAVLGASPAAIRREIDIPIAGRGLVVGAGFAFAVSLGEFGATAFLPRGAENLTAPVALFRLLSIPGDALRGQAMALAVVLMVLVAVVAFVIESARSDSELGW